MFFRQCLKTGADILESSISRKIARKGMGTLLSAKKPKEGELQMDWLRSEDLKEEKVITTPVKVYHTSFVNIFFFF